MTRHVSSNALKANLRVLEEVDLFKGLNIEQLQDIGSLVREEVYPKDRVIFEQGDAGTEFFVILTGRVRISRKVPGMGEEALTILGSGQSFGEMSLIEGSPRSADAYAHDTCSLLIMPTQSFHELLFVDKSLAHDVLWNIVRVLCARLRETNDKMTMLSVSSKF